MKKAISTKNAPQAVGPYSQAVQANGFLFLSGQIPLSPDGKMVEGDIAAKTRQCLENMRELLKAAGADFDNLVKVTVFVTHMGNFDAVNKVYAEYFEGKVPPARSFIQVAALPKGALVEIEGIAAL